MSRKPVAPVPSEVASREAVSGPVQTGRARVFHSTDVACSYCGALPGQPCRDRTGKIGYPGSVSHNSRIEKAEHATKVWAAWHGDKNANAELPPL
jgi:hypothetical protein